MAIRILCDPEQRRLSRDRITVTATARQMDGPDFANAWIEPVRKTLMLRPRQIEEAWATTGTGAYARLRKSDFSVSGDLLWQEKADQHPTDYRLHRLQPGMPASALTNLSYGKNRGMYLSAFTFGITGEKGVIADAGWGNTGDYLSGVSARIRLNGEVEVYRTGNLVEVGALGNKGPRDATNQYSNFILLPWRRRELLVYSVTAGEGFSVVFPDIAEDDENPIITPDEKMWFYVPEGAVDVQLSPLRFPTTGHATSIPASLRAAPSATDTFESFGIDSNLAPSLADGRIYGDPPYAGAGSGEVSALKLQELTGGAEFAPNGVKRACLLRIEMTSNGKYTPFVYGGHKSFAPIYESTVKKSGEDGLGTDLTRYCRNIHLQLTDSAEGAKLTFEVVAPAEAGALAPGLADQENRPFLIVEDDLDAEGEPRTTILLSGKAGRPKFVDGYSDEARSLAFEVSDLFGSSTFATFREVFPMDGLPLALPQGDSDMSAARYLLEALGVERDRLDIHDANYRLPEIPAGEHDEDQWNHLLKVGDKRPDALRELTDRYAAGWLYGIAPGFDTGTAFEIGAYYWNPDDLPTTPDVTLYRSVADAIAAGEDPDEAEWLTYDDYDDDAMPLEANEVWATGRSPRDGRPLQAFAEDRDSQDPTIAPEDRGPIWVGDIRTFGVVDPRLTRQVDCERTVEYLFPILTGQRKVAQWTARWRVLPSGKPMWRATTLVRLDGKGDFRITSMTLPFADEASLSPELEPTRVRLAHFTGGWSANRGGKTAKEIISLARAHTVAQRSEPRVRSGLVLFNPRDAVHVTP